MKHSHRAKQYVLAYDLHVPNQHMPSWNAVVDYVANNTIDGFVFGGDQLDLACVSHHTKGKTIFRERGALAKNIEEFDKLILTSLEKLLRPGAEKIWITGNHERFIQDLIEEQPELDGMISIEDKLRLRDRGWKVIPLGGHHELGHLNAIHGETVGGGMNPAKKAVEVWCSNVVLGHHHTSTSYTKASPAHLSKRWTATVLPCLSTTAPSYGRGRANTWLNGFGIVEVRPDKNFNLFSITVTDGEFSFGGKIYGTRKYIKKAA